MDFDSLQDDNVGASAAPATQQAPAQQEVTAGQTHPAFDDLVSDEDKYGTRSQTLKAGVEGVAQGLLGPVAPFLEKRYLGVNPEDIRGREAAHPYVHAAGEIGGLLSPVGEGAALAKVGEGIKGALGIAKESPLLAKIAGSAAAQAAEMGLYQSGDEISKMIKEDPNSSAQSAIANVGLSAALGGVMGGGLASVSPLWKAAIGDRAGQILEDFKGRANFRLNNPDIPEAFHNELDKEYATIKNMTRGVFGDSGLKAEALEKTLPELNDKIVGQASDIKAKVENSITKLMDEQDPHAKILARDLQKYSDVLGSGEPTSMQVFKATEDLKQQLQSYGKFNKEMVPLGEHNFRNTAKSLSHDLRLALEDSEVWGKAGELQKDLNAAVSKHIPALKNFESKFTQKLATGRVLDPGKSNTYINQLGKPNAEIKQDILREFLKTSKDMRSEVSKIHQRLGIDSPIPNNSLAVINDTLGTKTAGAKFADKLIDHGINKIAGKTAGGVTGGVLGSFLGHPDLGAIIGQHALGPMFESVLPGLSKPLMDNPSSIEGMKSAIDYGVQVLKGEKQLSKSTKAVFTPGAQVLTAQALPDEKDREKLSKLVIKSQENPQHLIDSQPKHIGHYLPNHQGAVAETTTAAVQYLQTLRPQEHRLSPLDKPIQPTPAQEARYNRALDIASNPAIVLNHIKNGTLLMSDLMDVKSMYPSYFSNMCQKLSNEVANSQDADHQIPYKTKMALSLCLGQPLDSSMAPQSIQAAQMSQMRKPVQPQGQNQTKPKPSQLKDKSANSYKTPSQEAESDRSARN